MLSNFMTRLVTLWSRAAATRDRDRGAAMVEYGLIIAVISVVVVVAVATLGQSLTGLFQGLANMVTANTP